MTRRAGLLGLMKSFPAGRGGVQYGGIPNRFLASGKDGKKLKEGSDEVKASDGKKEKEEDADHVKTDAKDGEVQSKDTPEKESKIAKLFENMKYGSMKDSQPVVSGDEQKKEKGPKIGKISQSKIAEILENVKKNVRLSEARAKEAAEERRAARERATGGEGGAAQGGGEDQKDSKGDSTQSELAAWSEALFGHRKTSDLSSSPDSLVSFNEGYTKEDRPSPDHPMFNDEYTSDINPDELDQMMTVYDLLHDHIKDITSAHASFKPIRCPLFDELDFPVSRLPKLPPEILDAYKKEFPVEKIEDPPILGSKLRAKEKSSRLPGDQESWNKVDGLAPDEENKNRIARRTASDDRPTRMQNNPLMNPTNVPKIPPPCRLTAIARPGRLDIDYRQAAVLDEFLLPSGRIAPATMTHLHVRQHYRMSKKVKVARNMRLLDIRSKAAIPPEHDLASMMLLREVLDEIHQEKDAIKNKVKRRTSAKKT
eukprot:CAMPEP_0113964582 /NCGR_PEP_ID=MMETSP0011_2-20120614/7233_1 /TAXON_ID=101924 /ORGANISM="Rhodosorus marinus" /LENGTH=481 /DNA_ID=CAMNT_0000976927 /DNA_START=1385 /DNA_END=2830 /DNA_ORIENTATION=+ /assembly_acc=CAM_ASM_000156